MTLLLPGAFSRYYVPASLFENVSLDVKQEVFTFLNNSFTHIEYLLCLGELAIEQGGCCLETKVLSANTAVSSLCQCNAVKLPSQL